MFGGGGEVDVCRRLWKSAESIRNFGGRVRERERERGSGSAEHGLGADGLLPGMSRAALVCVITKRGTLVNMAGRSSRPVTQRERERERERGREREGEGEGEEERGRVH